MFAPGGAPFIQAGGRSLDRTEMTGNPDLEENGSALKGPEPLKDVPSPAAKLANCQMSELKGNWAII